MLSNAEPGAYIIHLEIPVKTKLKISVQAWSCPIRRIQGSGCACCCFLENLAQAGGGRVITDPADVFSGEVQNVGARRNLTNLFVLLALILLLFDIALRKLQIPIEPILLFWREKVAAPVNHYLSEVRNRKITYASVDPVIKAVSEEGTVEKPAGLERVEEKQSGI